MKQATMSLVLVLSACTIREARPNRVNLADELTSCLEQDPGWENLDGLDLHVGGQVRSESDAVEQCLQTRVNGAGLEARRKLDERIVRITWLKTAALSDENTQTLSNGQRVAIKRAWYTPPQKLSGPMPHVNLDGDFGAATVRCRLPTNGHPERCVSIKPLRGQNLTEFIERSVFSPCLLDGEPFECDLTQQLEFRLAK